MSVELPFWHHPQRHCFEDIWKAVHEKEKQDLAFHIALWSNTVHWNATPSYLYRRVLSRTAQKDMLQSTARRYTMTKGFNFRKTKSLIHGVKDLGKIKKDNVMELTNISDTEIFTWMFAFTHWCDVINGQNTAAILWEDKVEGGCGMTCSVSCGWRSGLFQLWKQFVKIICMAKLSIIFP